MILGQLAAGRGMYASDTLLVRSDVPLDQLAERLRHAAGKLVAAAREQGLTAAGARHVAPLRQRAGGGGGAGSAGRVGRAHRGAS